MRPTHLTIQAFGAYAGRLELDLERLGPNALFLVHGPTGAGKTTLIDAITWALFGDGTLSDRSVVRSDHAVEEVATEVTLGFVQAGQRYRIWRKAPHARAKKRGEGTITESGRAELHRIDGAGVEVGDPLAVGFEKVTAEAETLLGLAIEQFRQVAVLPQGQFRRLLAADSKEREAILRVLFQTDRLERLQAFLKERAADLRRGWEDGKRQREQLLAEAELADEAALLDELEASATAIVEATARLEEERARASAATSAQRVGEDAAAKLAELAAATEADATVRAALPTLAAWREELRAARGAQALEPSRRAASDAERRRATAERDAAAARAASAAADTTAAAAEAAHASERARDGERLAARSERLRIEALGGRVEAHRNRLERLRTAQTALAEAVATEAAARRAVDAAVAHEAVARAALDDSRRAQAELPAVQARLDALEKAAKARARLSALRLQLTGHERRLQLASTTLDTARATLDIARGEVRRIETAWRDGQAGRLAAMLALGEPCPVCGSSHHPAPAATADLVDDAALAAARTTADEADVAWTQAQEAHAVLLTTREALARDVERAADELGPWGEPGAEDLDEALMETRSTAEGLADAVGSLDAREEAWSGATVAVETARHALDAATTNLGHRSSEHAAAEADTRSAAAELPEDWRALDAAGLHAAAERAAREAAERLAALEAALERADAQAREATTRRAAAHAAANAALALAEAASRDAASADETWRRAAGEAGFVDVEAAEAARREAARIDDLERDIAATAQQIATATDRLERAARAAAGLVAPDLAALRSAAEAATAAVEAVLQEEVRRRERKRQLHALQARLAALGRDLEAAEARYRLVGGLADIAEGKGLDQRINFQRFVLGALLDEVLEAATHRLRAMSRGRYVLHRPREGGHRGRAAGLDLAVEDAWTGRSRPATSLSGGESFMAALSLALGLADVVQRRAGGRRVDMLFVDEGFGTLDPEALDSALQALIDLRADGRLVGVISHVPELKERIDVRLEVTRGENGSTARLVLP